MRGWLYRKARDMRDETGAITVITALAFVALVGFAALAIDFGNYYSKQNRLQTACDAAALAAASYLPTDTVAAQNEAKRIMKENGYEIDSADITFLNNNSVVQIEKETSAKTMFAKVLNIDKMAMKKMSQATRDAEKVKFRLDYALFSGSSTIPLPINGSTAVNGGNAHTNNAVKYRGVADGGLGQNSFSVEKKFTSLKGEENTEEAMQRPSNTQIVNEVVPMPDYHDAIMSVLPQDYVEYTDINDYKLKNSDKYDAVNNILTVSGDVAIGSAENCNYKMNITGNLKIAGKADFKQSVTIGSIAAAGSIYVTGNENINFAGSMQLNGYIVAQKNIVFNGVVLGLNNFAQSVIYSTNGDVNFLSPSPSTVYGLIYVPNGEFYVKEGTSIYINGGGLVTDHIKYDSGSVFINSDTTGTVKWDDRMTITNPGAAGKKVKLIK